MPKLIVSVAGEVLSEWPLEEKQTVIGRGPDCEVQLNDPSVSRHHAKVARIYTGFFVEDLQSTNGVTLNGRRVRKHMLQDGDIVQIGTHELRFVAEEAEQGALADTDKTVVLAVRPRNADLPASSAASLASATAALDKTLHPVTDAPLPKPRRRIAAPPPSEQVAKAYVRVLNGPGQGDSNLVDKALYTIGQPGGNLAVISRRAQGHFLLHLGGDQVTTLNGDEVVGAGVKLKSGDIIQVGDTRLEFYSEP
jgi:pSer/pThr/pTyr-binding forkhead associated (FHA) protein